MGIYRVCVYIYTHIPLDKVLVRCLLLEEMDRHYRVTVEEDIEQ